jgi:signal transduction histidine kinase
VEHIARAHGGGVWVDSMVGVGSTFGLWIPARGAAEVRAVV